MKHNCILQIIIFTLIQTTTAKLLFRILSGESTNEFIREMYSGNISKAITEVLKGIPTTELTIAFDRGTEGRFINNMQMMAQSQDISTKLFNITLLQQQERFFTDLLDSKDIFQRRCCIFFCRHRMYEHILVELTENNLIHRNNLFIFYWGRKPFKRYFVRSLHEGMSTVVITNPRNDTYRIFYNQAVSHRKHHLSMINWWSEPGGLFRRPTLPSAKEIYKDFKGKIFSIPVIHKPPWYFVKYTNESLEVIGGRDKKLLAVIAEKLNFRYEYFDPLQSNLDAVISNNSFQSAIEIVSKREADFFLGDVTLTLDRSSLVEFSFLTLADSGAFITHAPSRLNEALALIRPFQWMVWPPVALIVIISGPILYMLIAIPDTWRPKPCIRSHMKLFSDCVWFMTASFLRQIGKEPSRADRPRFFIITISLAATYVIGDMYSANLTSLLARPGREKPVTNLVELEAAMLNEEYELFVEERGSFHDLLQNDIGIYGRLWKLMNRQHSYVVDSIEEGVKLVKKYKNIVVIAERETLFFDSQRFGSSNFHLSEKLNTAYSAIALQPGCAYLENINKVLMGIFEAGILTKMTENEYEKLGKQQMEEYDPEEETAKDLTRSEHKAAKASDDTEKLKPLSIKMLQGAFYVLTMGYFISACVLFTESKIHKYLKKRRLKIKCHRLRKFKRRVHIVINRIYRWLARKYYLLKHEITIIFLEYME